MTFSQRHTSWISRHLCLAVRSLLRYFRTSTAGPTQQKLQVAQVEECGRFRAYLISSLDGGPANTLLNSNNPVCWLLLGIVIAVRRETGLIEFQSKRTNMAWGLISLPKERRLYRGGGAQADHHDSDRPLPPPSPARLHTLASGGTYAARRHGPRMDST